MTDPTPSPSPDVLATLRPVLTGQLAALRGRYALHGAATVVAMVGAAIAVAFGLDRWLDLPLPIRLFHTLLVVGLLAFGAVRFLRYPLTRRFAEVDLAIWFERTFPALHQRLVSAVQLQALPDDALRNQSRPMIDQLLAETAATVRTLPLRQLFDPRPTRRVGGIAALFLATAAGGVVLAPATMQAFLLRHLGFAARYPRATTLHVELPAAGPDLQRTDRGEQTELVLPAGADLHVSVFVEGTVPPDVQLVVRPLGGDGEARAVPMTPRPGERFRHVFRRLTGSFEFHARGGDDERGDRLVTVRTVHPPQVSALVAMVTPPAYTGQAPGEQRGGAIEALLGSDVALDVTTTMPVRTATMVFLESGRRLELQAVAPQDDSVVSTAWRGRFQLQATDRYQIELLADNGLRNPNPGTWPLLGLQDYAPIGRWLLPEDEGALLLPNALLCLRVEARDDFGLRNAELAVQRGGGEPMRRQLLPPSTGAPERNVVLSELLEVKDLLGDKPTGNDGIVLTMKLLDNKAPEAGVAELPARIVQIVDEAQLTAHIARLFRGLREEVAQAHDLQVDRRGRLEDLTTTGKAPGGDVAQALTAIEVGQNRIQNGAERVLRGLMR
ncbi:MAG: hypothetical protein JNK15_00515, partial [Planctomycetes bacterium]|nr:hypothetical protein [Planctomycetota bacterium]